MRNRSADILMKKEQQRTGATDCHCTDRSQNRPNRPATVSRSGEIGRLDQQVVTDRPQPGNALKTSDPLVPPNPKELEIAARRVTGCALLGT